ncbi:GNAT family N-acetyltransferase [Glutamicibacter sp. M10]|uniref:GNAT family N-acetyltransferase n=1 Tax=Glutamicibacter sp. M10 TaxID=3023076 RepID=UPI0021C98A32|nr:GNAT family N-acetyltransferase [Glutamicibacter sp. M10]UXN32811.1 GNAT family N-acetyltransferase [Glutamicibacter sp. M10]
MPSPSEEFLALYDAQLRTDAETPSALSVTMLGELRLVTFANGRGFITYPHITDQAPQSLAELVPAALEHFTQQPEIRTVEFKTRGHDHAPGLAQRLEELGFVAEPTESIMIGLMQTLISDQPTPEGVEVRQVTTPAEIEQMCRMVDQAFGEPYDPATTDALISRSATKDGMELWVAIIDGHMVGAGRLEPVVGTEFAGLWGGGVLPEYRGRGIYRALTDARARSALSHGLRYVHSDSTEYSRPILESQGLLKVSTTTPYVWNREV